MKEGEKSKKSKKWIIAIVLIAIIAMALALYSGIFSVPTGLIVASETKSETTETPSTTAQQPTYTVTGTEFILKEVTENLPYYESLSMEPGRYVLEFESDVPVLVFVYNEMRFNQWKEGRHTYVLAGTGCCKDEQKTKSYVEMFTFTKSDGDKAYIVVEGAEKASIKYRITQNLKFE